MHKNDCKASAYGTINLHMFPFASSSYVKTEIVTILPYLNSSWILKEKFIVYGLISYPRLGSGDAQL